MSVYYIEVSKIFHTNIKGEYSNVTLHKRVPSISSYGEYSHFNFGRLIIMVHLILIVLIKNKVDWSTSYLYNTVD